MCRQLIVIAFIVFYSLTARAETVEIESPGKTSNFTYSKTKARESAVYNAFVDAFKKTMIPLVLRETIIEANSGVLERNIYTKANQFIEKYRVLNQKEDKGSFEVNVKVSIKKDVLEKELHRLGLSLRTSERPRFIILNEFKSSDEISKLLSSHLEKGGFLNNAKAIDLSAGERDHKNLAEQGKSDGADFVLHVYPNGEEYALRIIEIRTSHMLQSFTYSLLQKKALILAKMYVDVIETALPFWTQNEENTEKSIIVSLVYFQTYQEIESFKTLVRSIRGVEDVQERSVIKVGKDKKMRFLCTGKLTPHTLIREIQAGTMPLKLVAFEGKDISFAIERESD